MKNIYLTLVLESIYSVSRFKRIRRRRKKKIEFWNGYIIIFDFSDDETFFSSTNYPFNKFNKQPRT